MPPTIESLSIPFPASSLSACLTPVRADDGVVIVDVWHSREDFQKMMDDPEFQKNLEAAGWPTKPQLVEVYEVHASII